jgi:Rrf2 family nitric oxide-sensitive transcriptional repressor
MQLTRQSHIAIGILVACARASDRYMHTDEAAIGTGATRSHAAKVAHLLLRAGFVRSARGRKGGIRLARPADAISLGAILRRTQPEFIDASAGRAGKGGSGALDAVIAAGWSGFVQLMDGFSIADLVEERSPQRRACLDCRMMPTVDPTMRSDTRLPAPNERPDAHVHPSHR